MTSVAPPQKKRLCVLSDGSWNTPENPTPSNIVKLTEAIRHADDNGIQQIVFYDRGVGTSGGRGERLMGGAFGNGIDQNIQELYTFLAHNYEDGDEVYMFGFSRGAYTVRSLAGLIHDCGLCRRHSLSKVKKAYELYRKNLGEESSELKAFRDANGDRIPIELMMCFDTVGSLGIPASIGWLNGLTREWYEFHDTSLSEDIKHGIHCLSIDEDKAVLIPTLMVGNKKVKDQVTEMYFWGSHGGVGGSETTEQDAGAVTLRFTLDEMFRRGLGLAFNTADIADYPDIVNSKGMSDDAGGIMSWLTPITGIFVRQVQTVDSVHFTAIKRFQKNAGWRPGALNGLKEKLLSVIL